MDIYHFLVQELEKFPMTVQLVWVLCFVLLVIVIGLIIFLKILRSRLRRNEKSITNYQQQYEASLVTYLYSGNEDGTTSDEQQTIIDSLKKSVKKKFTRKIVVSALLMLKNEISGEMAKSIQNLYFLLGLKDFAYRNLNNKSWYIIAKGIRELTQFKVEEAYDKIITFEHHSKREVRNAVQLYLVDLFCFKGLEFLNDLISPLSEWEQIQLLEILKKSEDQEIQDVSPWLKSTNDSVVVFALKLAEIYNQFEVKDTIVDLLAHKNETVRVKVIHVLGRLQILEGKEVLIANFSHLSLREQIAFFNVLEDLCDPGDESFILEQVHHKNFEIKLIAMKILKLFNVEKLKSLNVSSSDLKFTEILNFVVNN